VIQGGEPTRVADAAGDHSERPTYYTVSDENYFLGTVALLNSLRLTGNAGELLVLDAGLSHSQRRSLAEHAIVFDPPIEIVHPFLLTTYAHFCDLSGSLVVIDSDIIVTRSLDDILERAASGSICAYPDGPETRMRWFSEWHERLQLRSPLSRDACINAGLVAFDIDHWPNLLARWWEICQLIPADEVFVPGPFQAGDQDALNALLMSELPRERLSMLPESETGFGVNVGATIKVEDFTTLRCTFEGHPTRILHFIDRPKPWERSGWTRLGASDYVRLMRRLLFSDDVAMRVRPSQCPLWLRPSAGGEFALKALGGANRAALAAVHRMPDPLVERLRRLRRAIV
jgi:lipopolysaccharide biosynthesis glycosyltransferase